MPRMYSARVALALRMSSVTRFLAKVASELSLPLLGHGHPYTFRFNHCNFVGHQTVQVGKLWQHAFVNGAFGSAPLGLSSCVLKQVIVNAIACQCRHGQDGWRRHCWRARQFGRWAVAHVGLRQL